MKKETRVISLIVFFSLIFTSILLSLSLVSAGELRVTQEHPFLVDNNWIGASELEVGDLLTTPSGEKVRITSLEDVVSGDNFLVYNLEVENYSNFIVSSDNLSVVVHNSKNPNWWNSFLNYLGGPEDCFGDCSKCGGVGISKKCKLRACKNDPALPKVYIEKAFIPGINDPIGIGRAPEELLKTGLTSSIKTYTKTLTTEMDIPQIYLGNALYNSKLNLFHKAYHGLYNELQSVKEILKIYNGFYSCTQQTSGIEDFIAITFVKEPASDGGFKYYFLLGGGSEQTGTVASLRATDPSRISLIWQNILKAKAALEEAGLTITPSGPDARYFDARFPNGDKAKVLLSTQGLSGYLPPGVPAGMPSY